MVILVNLILYYPHTKSNFVYYIWVNSVKIQISFVISDRVILAESGLQLDIVREMLFTPFFTSIQLDDVIRIKKASLLNIAE